MIQFYVCRGGHRNCHFYAFFHPYYTNSSKFCVFFAIDNEANLPAPKQVLLCISRFLPFSCSLSKSITDLPKYLRSILHILPKFNPNPPSPKYPIEVSPYIEITRNALQHTLYGLVRQCSGSACNKMQSEFMFISAPDGTHVYKQANSKTYD